MAELNVQYGCGLSAPLDWVNFDSSPTLRLQRLPLLGRFIRKVDFPSNILYGDIIKGLPGIEENSCDAIYCSHVLEHLSLNDFSIAVSNTCRMLKKGGYFRCVLPDLEFAIDNYISDRSSMPEKASFNFLQLTLLGQESRPHGLKERLIASAGNSKHLWMWDQYSLKKALLDSGFSEVRKCQFNDSVYKGFLSVEEKSRFWGAIAFEAIK